MGGKAAKLQAVKDIRPVVSAVTVAAGFMRGISIKRFAPGTRHAPDVMLVPEDGIYHWSQAERGKLGGQTKIPHIDPTPDSSMIASLRNFHLHPGSIA